MELQLNCKTGNRSGHSDRRLADRLGCFLPWEDGLRNMVSGREDLPYQFSRIESSLLWPEVVCLPRMHVLLQTDNTTTIRYINKFGGTHSLPLCQLSIQLLQHTMQRQITLTTEYIPGKENTTADSLSRRSNPHQHEWHLCPKIFNKILQTTQTHPKVDLFASRINNQLEKFVSWRPDPDAMAVNAFVLDWRNLGELYMFPPPILIGRTLTKLHREKIDSAILISPFWPTRPWWPQLLESLTQTPWLLHQSRSFLTNPTGDSHPLSNLQQMRLLACVISGNSLKAEAFRTGLSKLSSSLGAHPPRNPIDQGGIPGHVGACRGRLMEPSTNDLLDFLSDIFISGISSSWIATLWSSLSTPLAMAGNADAIQNPLITRLIKGIDNIQPKKPRYTHTWNVSTLLNYLKSPQLDLSNIKLLAKKTVTLLTITTAARCSEIASIDVRYIDTQRIAYSVKLNIPKLGRNGR